MFDLTVARALLSLCFGLATQPAWASCICLTCALNPALENFRAVSGSMAPTFDTGACAVMRHIDPTQESITRGQVIGLVKEAGGPIFVYRVMALEGDTVAMDAGRVVLNGVPLVQAFVSHDDIIMPEGAPRPRCEGTPAPGERCRRLRFSETLPDGRSYQIYDVGPSPVDHTAPVTVPQGHVFVLGDHRDNASDSRIPAQMGGAGLVPIAHVKGVFDGM